MSGLEAESALRTSILKLFDALPHDAKLAIGERAHAPNTETKLETVIASTLSPNEQAALDKACGNQRTLGIAMLGNKAADWYRWAKDEGR